MKFAKLFAMCLMSFSMALCACDGNNESLEDETGGNSGNKNDNELAEFGTIRVTGVTGTMATVSMLPTDKEATYIGQIFGYDYLYNEYGEDYDAMFQFALEYLDENYIGNGYDWMDFTYTGNQNLNYTGMTATTRYIVLAAFVELDGNNLPKVASKTAYRQFTTTELTDDDVDTNWYVQTNFSEEGTDEFEFTKSITGSAIYYGDWYGIGSSDWETYMLYNEYEDIDGSGNYTLVTREIINAEFYAPITTVYPEPYGDYNMPEWVDEEDIYVEGSVLMGGYSPAYGFGITYYYKMEADFEQLMYIYTKYATAFRNAHVDIARAEGDTFEETREENLSDGEKINVLYRNCNVNISFDDYFGNKISGSYSGEFGCMDLSDDASTSSATLSAKRLRLFSTVANFERLETREAIIRKLEGHGDRTLKVVNLE